MKLDRRSLLKLAAGVVAAPVVAALHVGKAEPRNDLVIALDGFQFVPGDVVEVHGTGSARVDAEVLRVMAVSGDKIAVRRG